MDFMNYYYDCLDKNLEEYDLRIEQIYPKAIFMEQLRNYGVYGFCISTFGVPFFIANSNEYPDFDEAAMALSKENGSNEENGADKVVENTSNDDDDQEQYKKESATGADGQYLEILSERTLPIFKKRMTGIVEDLIQYDMVKHVLSI